MKYLILIFASIFFPFCIVSAQANQNTQKMDSIITLLQSELNVEKAKVSIVLGVIDSSWNKIYTIATDRLLTKQEKDEKIKELTQVRDNRLKLLLTEIQIQKLRTFLQERQNRFKKPSKKG